MGKRLVKSTSSNVMECAHAGGILGVSKLIYIRACVERSVGGGCNIVRWHFVIDLDLVSRPAPAQDNLRSISLAIQMVENRSSSQAQGEVNITLNRRR